MIVALEEKVSGTKNPKENRSLKMAIGYEWLFNGHCDAPLSPYFHVPLLALDKANLVTLYLLGVVLIALWSTPPLSLPPWLT